jgi:hypothetical protein
MSAADVLVLPIDAGWEIRRAGSIYPSSRHRTRGSAVKVAKIMAEESGSAVFVHELDGRVTKHEPARRPAQALRPTS